LHFGDWIGGNTGASPDFTGGNGSRIPFARFLWAPADASVTRARNPVFVPRGALHLLVAVVLTATAVAAPARTDLDEKPWDQLSDRKVSDWGRTALDISAAKWKHGETEHFIIHFFRNGDMIARRSEKFYSEIREFFGNRNDLLGAGKSHIFAFYETADWLKFKAAVKLGQPVAGVTRGDEFFYMPVSEDKQFDQRGKVQAHEMTHLVFNRLFTGRPPLWLNEGVAEYFGLKKTTDTTTFRSIVGYPAPFGVDHLLQMKAYPESEADVHSFYAEATILLDFLTQTADRRALLPKFIDAMIARNDVDEALKLYGFKTRADFQKAYDRHRALFPKR
jgi:hypothetical protein